MAKNSKIPWFLPTANKMVSTLMRIGVKLNGPGKCPMYLFTVRGRKSGQLRTTPIAVLELNGNRYLMTPYGVVDWVRNVRAAGEATFTRGRRTEQIRPIELPVSDAIPILKSFVESGNPIAKFFDISAQASPEDFEKLATTHPVFMLQSAASPALAAVRQARSA
ncbi:MAG TPA: nitroreductase/quinone reductase family protein [Chloroflexia bacterium]|nr:nitroreductase/quinone reductase family protein [Chloroflexia bacterium]